jgi:predicted RNA-binding Zn-ribbon protein involved in translation (DUF1610 family)
MYLNYRGGSVTDHLEPYRRMARSIKFFPPSALAQTIPEPISQPVTSASVVNSWTQKTSSNADVKPIEPPIDLSEHVTALVHEAVCKPTVLPATYIIPENIGDRISRMAASKSVVSVNTQPNILQPALNGNAVHISDYESNADRLVYDAHRQVYALASTIVATSATVTETPSAQVEPVVVTEIVAATETTIEEPIVVTEIVAATETPAAEVEAIQTPTLIEKVSSVIEAVSTAFMHPEAIRKESEATEAAPVEKETIEQNPPDTEALLPTAAALPEAEAAPSLLERVSAVVEVVTTTLKNPEAPEIASNTKPITAACPTCGSIELRKNGRRQGKQRYACKECGRQFAIAEVALVKEKLEAQESPTVEAATEAASIPEVQPAKKVTETETATDSVKSGGKKKKAKGFGAKKK